MAITTLKVLASVLQLHGPGATIQSDHQGIDALLSDLQSSDQPVATEVYFRRGGFVRGARAGGFRRAADTIRVRARSAEGDLFEDTRLIVASSS